MKRLHHILPIALIALTPMLLTSCEEADLEEAGENIEELADDTGDAIENTAENIGEAAEDAWEYVDDLSEGDADIE